MQSYRLLTRLAAWICILVIASPVSAELVRWEITSREPYAAGRQFGTTGAYQRISGKVYFELDPNAAANALIVDLNKVPVNAGGRVEFWGDLVILAPVDLSKSNGTLLYDVNNRGNKTALG
jgi:hypothetical protein